MKDIIVFGKGWYYDKKKMELEKEYRIIAILDNAAGIDESSRKETIPIYSPRYPMLKLLLCLLFILLICGNN